MMKDEHFNLDEKDIFKLLNQVNINESEFNDMDDEVQKIQKERIKKNMKKRIKSESIDTKTRIRNKVIRYSCAAAITGVVCLAGAATAFPAFAKNIPILNSIIQSFNSEYGDHGDYTKYSELINKSVTDNGITISINEALADDSELVIGYTITSSKSIKGQVMPDLLSDMKVNGKSEDAYGSSGGKYLNDCTYVGLDSISTDQIHDLNNFNVDLKINDISKELPGEWNFAFSVSKEDLIKNSTIIYPNTKIDFPDSVVNFDKLMKSPLGITIYISGNYKDKGKQSHFGIFDYNNWLAFDDKGVELYPKSIGGGTSNINKQPNFKSQMSFANLSDDSKYVTIIPYKVVPSEMGSAEMDKDGNEKVTTIEGVEEIDTEKTIDGNIRLVSPIQLPQGKMGKLFIKDIFTKDNVTTVKYTAEGIAPLTQGNALRILDDKGNSVKLVDQDIRKDATKPNEFTMRLAALDPNKKYTLHTTTFNNYEVRDDLKLTIRLTK